MIRTLQRKFVFTAMAAITVLILFLLGVINGANFVIVGNQIDRTLQVVAEHADGEGEQPPTPDDRAPRPFMDAPKNEYDIFLSSNFFVVRFDQSGTIVYTDVSRTSAVTEEEAQSMAAQIYASGRDSGRTGRFRYLAGKSRSGQGDILVFLDTSGREPVLHPGAAAVRCGGTCLLGPDAGAGDGVVPPGHPAYRGEYGEAEAVRHQCRPRDQDASGHHPVQHRGHGAVQR